VVDSNPDEEDDMRFALLINDLPGMYDALKPAERDAVFGEYFAISKDDRVIGGEQLLPAPMAKTVRASGGETLVIDGPFAETKESLGGYYVVEVDDLDDALEIAKRIPAVRLGGSVELRPVVER
jgi:hypothetical protein